MAAFILIKIFVVITIPLILALDYPSSDLWTQSLTLLPTATYGQAIGYFNHTISILGGYADNMQLVHYDILSDQMTIGTYFNHSVYGGSQFYTQIEEKLYYERSYELHVFNLKTKQYEGQISTVPSPDFYTCVASQSPFIFVPAGGNTGNEFDQLNVFNLSSEQWLNSSLLPTLNVGRGGCSCIATNNKLYVIGGNGGSGYLHTIERLWFGEDLSRIYTEDYVYIQNLSWPLIGPRAVVYGHDIVIFGGLREDNLWIKTIHVIDSVTDTVRTSGSAKYEESDGAAVIVEGVAYIFGGRSDTGPWHNTFQYVQFPETLAPTSSPTRAPTSPSSPPTMAPSRAPSMPPSSAPSMTPSLAPSSAPSTPPTRTPSTSPTMSPSRAPSSAPSTSPTRTPSIAPSITPSRAPSYAPSSAPSAPPTRAPSSVPSNPPTGAPSIAPSSVPSNIPSNAPSKSPVMETIAMDSTQTANDSIDTIRQYELDVQHLYDLYIQIVVAFGILCGLVLVSGMIDAKMIRINDYFNWIGIVSVFLQTNDTISDGFFSAQIHAQNRIEQRTDYDVILGLSIAFIILPSLTALIQLFLHAKNHWIDQNEARSWLAKFTPILLIMSVMTGSPFAAVPLLNSYLFQLNIFDMGLTDRELRQFATQRVYSIVLLENVPQLVLQCYYLSTSTAEDDSIAVASIVFSALSVCIAVLSMLLAQKIMSSEGYSIVRMDVTGRCVTKHAEKCRILRKKLSKELSKLFGIKDTTMEIIKPTCIQNGFTVTFYVYFHDTFGKVKDYKQLLEECNKDNRLSELVRDSWDLDDAPVITNIECIAFESKQQRMNAISNDGVEMHSTQMHVN
eukprot:14694_1